MSGFRLDHVHIFTGDPESTATWFAEKFGGELLRSRQSDGRPRVDVKFGSICLYVSRAPDGVGHAPNGHARRMGMDHIGFSVADVDAAVATLVSQGVEVVSGPVTTRPGVRAAYVRGPEGILIEVMHRSSIDYRGLESN